MDEERKAQVLEIKKRNLALGTISKVQKTANRQMGLRQFIMNKGKFVELSDIWSWYKSVFGISYQSFLRDIQEIQSVGDIKVRRMVSWENEDKAKALKSMSDSMLLGDKKDDTFEKIVHSTTIEIHPSTEEPTIEKDNNGGEKKLNIVG